jgi:hypothetical protein
VSFNDIPTGEPASPPQSADVAVERIAEQLAVLDTIAERPLSEHADAYQQIHAALQGALAEIDGA